MDNLKWWQKRKCDHSRGIRNVIFFKEKYAKKLAEFSTLKTQVSTKIQKALQFVQKYYEM